jgi:hypothetical protein
MKCSRGLKLIKISSQCGAIMTFIHGDAEICPRRERSVFENAKLVASDAG